MHTLSIIIPIYNVERYIRPCVESIFLQNLDERQFEVILVDDGTPDKSIESISDLMDAHDNISVVRQTNQGLSAARNTGLTHATGKYILFLDSDDLLVSNSLAPLIDEATSKHPDLIVAGFEKRSDTEIDDIINKKRRESDTRYTSNVAFTTMTGSQLFVSRLNPQQCYVWRTIYRKSFLDDNNLRFIPGIYFEDVPFTSECYIKAKTCLITEHIFYIYRQRPGSIVSAITMKKVIDFNRVIARLWELKSSMPLSPDEQKKINDTAFVTFSIATWYISHHRELLAERRTFIDDLHRQVPHLRFSNGAKQRIVSLLFTLMPSTYLKVKALLNNTTP